MFSQDMESLKKEMEKADVDWAKIKEILSGISAALEAVGTMIPIGLIRNLVLGLAAAINLVIAMLPSSEVPG